MHISYFKYSGIYLGYSVILRQKHSKGLLNHKLKQKAVFSIFTTKSYYMIFNL